MSCDTSRRSDTAPTPTPVTSRRSDTAPTTTAVTSRRSGSDAPAEVTSIVSKRLFKIKLV